MWLRVNATASSWDMRAPAAISVRPSGRSSTVRVRSSALRWSRSRLAVGRASRKPHRTAAGSVTPVLRSHPTTASRTKQEPVHAPHVAHAHECDLTRRRGVIGVEGGVDEGETEQVRSLRPEISHALRETQTLVIAADRTVEVGRLTNPRLHATRRELGHRADRRRAKAVGPGRVLGHEGGGIVEVGPERLLDEREVDRAPHEHVGAENDGRPQCSRHGARPFDVAARAQGRDRHAATQERAGLVAVVQASMPDTASANV